MLLVERRSMVVGKGTSTVKYTTPVPCEGKIYKHLKNRLDLQSQAIHVDKKISRKIYIF